MTEIINLTEAAHRSQVTAKTLALWLRKWAGEGLLTHTQEPPPIGSRVGGPGAWRIDADELAALVQRYVPARQRKGATSGTSEAEVTALRTRVAALEEEITALHRRLEESGASRLRPLASAAMTHLDDALDLPTVASSDSPLSTPQGYAGKVPQPRARQRATTKPLRDSLDPPVGWVTRNAYADTHGIPRRTVEYYEGEHKLTVTHNVSYRTKPGAGTYANNWLTPEQQVEFHQAFVAKLGDPCRVCGWSTRGSADIDEAASRASAATVPMKRADAGSAD